MYKVESQICSAVPSNREPHRTLQGSVAVSVELEERSGDGSTPLHWAADNGHLPVVQYLCEQGADKDSRDDDDDNTLLHFAALHGHLPVVQCLCELGADKKVRDRGGNTYLDFAAAYRSPLCTDQDGDY